MVPLKNTVIMNWQTYYGGEGGGGERNNLSKYQGRRKTDILTRIIQQELHKMITLSMLTSLLLTLNENTHHTAMVPEYCEKCELV